MSSREQEPILSNDEAEIIIVDETVGLIDTTHRPASEVSRKAIQKQLVKEAEVRQLLEKSKENDNETKIP